MGFIKIFVEIIPYLAVFVILGHITKLQQKRAKKREEEQKKGIIRTHYIIKTEKMLTAIFVVGIFFSGGCTIASALAGETLVPIIFGIACIFFFIGSLNMIMWKLEVNGDEITWRSTFGKKRTFHFEDITKCEMKGNSIRVYVDGKKLFTLDSGIDDSEFMEDIERRKIPVRLYWGKSSNKKRK